MLKFGKKGAPGKTIKKLSPWGLDIGTNFIKAVRLGSAQDDVFNIVNLICRELPADARDSQNRPRIISEIIKKLGQDAGLKGDCFACIPRSTVKINLLRLPRMPENEIERALSWEIKHSAPLEIGEMCIDYILLEKQKARFLGEQLGVLAIYAQNKDIFEYISFLRSCGLNVLGLDVEPLADLAAWDYLQSNSLGKKVDENEVVLLLDLGAGKTTLSIISNGELMLVRPINVTGNSLTEVVSKAENISWQEAEGLKKNLGVAHPSLLPLLENIAQDVEFTFMHFSYQTTQSQITRFDRLVLSGGGAILKGLDSFLAQRLKAQVEVMDILSYIKPIEAGPAMGALGGALNVAVGLALREK